MVWVALATEDELSEAVGKRLLAESGGALQVNQLLRKGGNGYLRSRINSWCEIARYQPVLLITDLDALACPTELLTTWLNARVKPVDLVFRVAVREIESWLLADHDGMKLLLGNGARNLPDTPDNLADPKRCLLTLAQKAPRAIRDDLVVPKGTIASQGLAYNKTLSDFVLTRWSPVKAAARSDSLRRARDRIRELAQ